MKISTNLRRSINRQINDERIYRQRKDEETAAQVVSTVITTTLTLIASYLMAVVPEDPTNVQIAFGVAIIVVVSVVGYLAFYKLALWAYRIGQHYHNQKKLYSSSMTMAEANSLILNFEMTIYESMATIEESKESYILEKTSRPVLSSMCYYSILDALKEMLTVILQIFRHRDTCINSESKIDGIEVYRIDSVIQYCSEVMVFLKKEKNEVIIKGIHRQFLEASLNTAESDLSKATKLNDAG